MERVGVEAVPERPRRPRLTAIEGQAVAEDVAVSDPPLQSVIDGQAQHNAAVSQQLEQWAKQLAAQTEAMNQRAAALTRVTQIHEASSRLLSTRAKLMLAVIGAFVLAMYAMAWQTLPGIAILIVWCVLTIGPLSFLEFTAAKRSQM